MRAFLILVTFVRNGPSAWAGQESSRLIAKHVSRTTSYFSGRNLVVVKEGRRLSRIDHLTHTDVQEAASETLQNILLDHLNYSGEETIVLTQHNVRTSSQSHHFKFKQHLHGLPIEGASIAMHVHENGTVYALNGEFHSSSSIGASEQALDCEEAMNLARNEEYGSEEEGWEWLSDCVDAAVQGRDGKAHFAFKRWLGRRHNNGISSGDFLFASRNDGSVLAVHPQVSRARSLATYDCESGTDTEECSLVSDSPEKIAISDVVAQDAHNHVVDVYDFYAANFGWNSFDGQDAAEIQVFVHFNLSFSDSYFFPHANGGGLVFGDGDGIYRTYYSQGFDIVAHEFTHGVVQYTSELVGESESGSLAEAFCDIMAATADRVVQGADEDNTWRIGEVVDIWDEDYLTAIRNLKNPYAYGYPAHYADRWYGSEDNGSVHNNSLIVGHAFYLMVQGGSEFEWQDEVPPLNTDFDLSIQEGAQLFFEANRDCFTESIDFVGARECTIDLATQAQEPSVRAAWDAVGVRGLCPLDNGVWKLGIELPDNGDNVIYVLNETVQKGETVKCELVGTDGDPDLYVKFGSHPDVTYRKKWRQSDCYSDGIGLLEACTTGPAPADDTEVFIGVSATRAVLDYSIKCQIASKRCRGVGMPCSAQSQCCGAFPFALACDGPRVGSTVCKTCLEFDRVCTRTSQCCQGLACRNRRCLLAKDPCSRTRNRRLAFSGRTKCTSIKQCCSTDRFPQTCDGTSAANRYCKTCYKEGRACTRNTECCPKWACLNRQCKKAVIK